MAITVEAVYENGVLKLNEPLPFPEHEKVSVTVTPKTNWVQETAGILGWKGSPELAERFALDADLDYPPPPEAP
jgi:predicted DNA-binding antitoxin AbrB/MazE fold protein